MLESVNKASGWTVVYKHCYIDENGKFRSIAYLRNDFMLNMSDKLREERRKNSEKLIERTKEKAAEKTARFIWMTPIFGQLSRLPSKIRQTKPL